MAEIVNDETLQMYIQESREHLETIESDLLEIEEQGDNIDEDLVNKVFRAAHSIKGGSGFLGLETIKDLSHKIENILDLVRNYKLTPSATVINTILKAFDHLGVLLENALESNGMEIDEHVTALGLLTSANLPPEEQNSLSNIVSVSHPDLPVQFKVSEFDLNQGRQGGKNIYILAYDLIKDIHRQDKVPMDVIKSLEDTGRILEITLSVDEVGDLDSEKLNPAFPMYVLFATIIEKDLMGAVMGLADAAVHMVTPEELSVTDEDETTPPKDLPPVPDPAPVTPRSKQVKTAPSPASSPAPGADPNKKMTVVQQETIRVQVQVLDQLMNRAGELVLARNQMLQTLASQTDQSIVAAGQRIDLVTSELQEIIMLTRMQPVANIFSKFPRVVRDMANQLHKEMSLDLQGKEVELDKTIIEGLADPLTHLVRNSADHGIELPDVRQAAGKDRNGSIVLRAFHESGQVIIEIEDDGKGLDPEKLMQAALNKELITQEQAQAMSDMEKVSLIMMPGFSTAKEVTDISGRGVGMDVVKTNLDKMGGVVEIRSKLGKGTVIRIKLPLTLAIIPSLLITSCKERFAMPQVNVRELLRISAKEARDSIERIGGAEVLVLRGELIPLLQLNEVLSLYPMFTDPKTGEQRPDRRNGVVDKRLMDLPKKVPVTIAATTEEQKKADERRLNRDSDIMIVVVQAGSFKYGLVVDQLHDTVEIVVKPLGRHLKHCNVFAGATIMGDGHVALILDVPGLANTANLQPLTDTDHQATRQLKDKGQRTGITKQTLLLFRNGSEEQCGVPLQLVLRIEQIKQEEIEIKGGRKVIQYRGGTLPVYALEEVANVEMLEAVAQLNVIIFVVAGREFGLLVAPPLDILDAELIIDEQTLTQTGISGSVIINDKTTLLIDIYGMMESLNPDWFDAEEQDQASDNTGSRPTILLAEDSNFFLAQVKQFVEESGYKVIGAEDGQVAWDLLEEKGKEISLVLTDIEMPVMDGFELTSKIRADERFSHLPVIALTSLAGEEDIARGKEVGIDEYQVKLDKEKLIAGIAQLLKSNRSA